MPDIPWLSGRSPRSVGRSKTDRSVSDTNSDPDYLQKRREVNRKSQQKSRQNKETLIRILQEENQLLKSALDLKAQSIDASLASSPRSGAHAHPSSASSSGPDNIATPSTSLRHHTASPHASHADPHPQPITVDVAASQQAFMAVIASVCDPHLNTIHAVAQKLSESKGLYPWAPPLNRPRPVDRPLNDPFRMWLENQTQLNSVDSLQSVLTFDNLTQYDAYIPVRGTEGPLAVPFLEPAHPVLDLELELQGVWAYVLQVVNIGRSDIATLASRLVDKVRCYGFGPVLMRSDVERVCRDFPSLAEYPLCV